jgi:hypothetical protein
MDGDEHVPLRVEATRLGSDAVGTEFFHFLDETFVVTVDLKASWGKGDIAIGKDMGDKEEAGFAAGNFSAVRFGVVAKDSAAALGDAGSIGVGDDPAVAAVSVAGATVGDKEDIVEVVEKVSDFLNGGLQ